MTSNTMLWRRLDTPGHDACRLVHAATGWRLEGAATFRHEDDPACLAYEVECDEHWRTRQGAVRGWVGERGVDADTLGTLHQRYERRSTHEYLYEAPQFDYLALLEVNEIGFVEKYPDLWHAEAT